MAESNPLHQLVDAHWALLEAHTEFTALVAERRRIKYIGSEKELTAQSALPPSDVPEVRIVLLSLTPHLVKASNSSMITVRLGIQVNTMSQMLDSTLDVIWAIYRATSNWAATIATLTWGGNTFAKRLQIVTAEPTLGASEFTHNKKAWSTVWACEVDLWFSVIALQNTGT